MAKRYLTSTRSDRRKAEMWCPIAKELGLSWESVDAMHWGLGKEEMALRAQEVDLRSESSGSFERTIKTKPESTYSATGTQYFEDFRVHHFNATRPPQVRLPMPMSPQPLKMTGPATIAKVSTLDLDHSASSFMGKNEETSPAEERKRQVSPTSKICVQTVYSLLVDTGTSCRCKFTIEDDCSRQSPESMAESHFIDIGPSV